MEERLRALLDAAEKLLEINKAKDHTKREQMEEQGELFLALARSEEIKGYIKQKDAVPQVDSLVWFNLVFAGSTLVSVHNTLSEFFDRGMGAATTITINHACWQNADFAFEGAIRLVKAYLEYDING